MQPPADITVLRLEYLNMIVCAVLIACVLRTKALRIYPLFLGYLLTFEIANIVDKVWWGTLWNRQGFAMCARYVMLVLITFTIGEVLRVVLKGYPGLAEFLKKNRSRLVGASIVVALLLFPLDPYRPWTHTQLFEHSNSLERSLYSGLLTYLLLVSVLIAWTRARVRPAAAFHIGSLVALFASNWAVLLLRSQTRRSMGWLDEMTLMGFLAFFVCWIVAMRTRSERLSSPTVRRWNPALFDQLWRQLESINASLVRFGRPNYE